MIIPLKSPISDGSLILGEGRRRYGRQGIVMNRDARNGFGFSSLVRSPGPRGKCEVRRDCQACRRCGCSQESAAREVLAFRVKQSKVIISLSLQKRFPWRNR